MILYYLVMRLNLRKALAQLCVRHRAQVAMSAEDLGACHPIALSMYGEQEFVVTAVHVTFVQEDIHSHDTAHERLDSASRCSDASYSQRRVLAPELATELKFCAQSFRRYEGFKLMWWPLHMQSVILAAGLSELSYGN